MSDDRPEQPQPASRLPRGMSDLRAARVLVLATVLAGPVVLAIAAASGWPAKWLVVLSCIVSLGCLWTLRASVWRSWASLRHESARAVRALSLGAAGSEQGEGLASRAEGVVRRLREVERDRAGLRSILGAVQSPLLVADASGQVLLCNPACEAFFAGRGGVVGRTLDTLFTQPAVLALHARAASGAVASEQLSITRDGTPRTYQIVAAPTESDTSHMDLASLVVMTLRDVTELAQAAALRTAFVANASHELRTPLASMRVAIDTLMDGAWDDHAMRGRFGEVIASNVQRLDDLVLDLLELSRLESPDMQPRIEDVALESILRDVREQFARVCDERRLTMHVEASPKASRLRSDRRLLLLILRNLVENATKYANEGTTITISVQPLPRAGASLGSTRARDGVRIRVIDVGLGIPIEHQQRIFERFYQVDPSRTGGSERRGTGLGLAIVKHAVKDLGGTITVDSVWKQGTTMIVDLPACLLRPDELPDQSLAGESITP